MSRPKIGKKVPLLSVYNWAQGEPTNFDQLTGKVVLVEVFQVNCPGCFLSSLPRAINLHNQYSAQGLFVLGIATAFEDFDKNTLENLRRLVKKGEVVGETLRLLEQNGKLSDGKLAYKIPFPLAMDRLTKLQNEVTNAEVTKFIDNRVCHFKKYSNNHQNQIRQQILNYLQARQYNAATFDCFNLQGTPSHIVVDKKGNLRAVEFGAFPEMEELLQNLLTEQKFSL